MEESSGGVGSIIGAVAQFGSTVIDAVTFRRRSQRDKLPDWLSPADFQRQDNTAMYALVGGAVILLFILFLISKKK